MILSKTSESVSKMMPPHWPNGIREKLSHCRVSSVGKLFFFFPFWQGCSVLTLYMFSETVTPSWMEVIVCSTNTLSVQSLLHTNRHLVPFIWMRIQLQYYGNSRVQSNMRIQKLWCSLSQKNLFFSKTVLVVKP